MALWCQNRSYQIKEPDDVKHKSREPSGNVYKWLPVAPPQCDSAVAEADVSSLKRINHKEYSMLELMEINETGNN